MLVYALEYVYNLPAQETKTPAHSRLFSTTPHYGREAAAFSAQKKGEKTPFYIVMALPKAERLRLRRDILRVLSQSQQRRGEFFTVRFHWKAAPPGRLAVVVPKRVAKHAVRRNALKRLVVEWVRTKKLLPRLAADIIVTALPPAAKAIQQALRYDLEMVLASAVRPL